MNAALALMFVLLAASPAQLPDDQGIDSLSFAFTVDDKQVFGPIGSLAIFADGKVSYHYSSQPWTGSGGEIVEQHWVISAGERQRLFVHLVDAGLLRLPRGDSAIFGGPAFTVTSGRWQRHLSARKAPPEVLAPLLPLLAKAHPDLWAHKSPKEPPRPRAKLTCIEYTYSEKPEGNWKTISILRDGRVFYEQTNLLTTDKAQRRIKKQWAIPTSDAEALLDALVDGGVCELNGDRFENHRLRLEVGDWSMTSTPAALPVKISRQLLPQLRRGDTAEGE